MSMQIAQIEDDPKRPWKALASAVSTAVGAFVLWWVADKGDFTFEDFKEAVGAAILASGLTGGTTFAVKNPKRSRSLDQRGAVDWATALLVVFFVVVILLLVGAIR